MGGISTGKFVVEEVDGMLCYRMIGNVSTKNNGGFIQIRARLSPKINSKDYNISHCQKLLSTHHRILGY